MEGVDVGVEVEFNAAVIEPLEGVEVGVNVVFTAAAIEPLEGAEVEIDVMFTGAAVVEFTGITVELNTVDALMGEDAGMLVVFVSVPFGATVRSSPSVTVPLLTGTVVGNSNEPDLSTK